MELSRSIEEYSEDYWGLFECPPRLPPRWEHHPPPSQNNNHNNSQEVLQVAASSNTQRHQQQQQQQQLTDLNKYSSQMESLSATLHRNKLPSSLVQSLLCRGTGIPNTDQIMDRLQNHMMHQLQAARAPTTDSSTNTVAAKEHNLSQTPRKGQQIVQGGRILSGGHNKKKWSRISSTASSKYKFAFVDNMIMMKEGVLNTRKFLYPNGPIFSTHSSPYTLQFSIEDNDKTKLKWRDHDVHLINMDNPQMELRENSRKVAKIPNSLVVLESSGKLARYDFNDGKKMEELDLTYPGGPLYSTLIIDYAVEEKGILVIANTTAAKKANSGMLLELLIISSYPKLRVCHRLLFPKSGKFGPVDDAVLIGGDLLVVSTRTTNHVECFKLDEVLAENDPPQIIGVTTSGNITHERVILAKKPTKSLCFKSKEGYSRFIDGVYPPTVCLKKTKDTYEIRCMDKPEEILGTIPLKTHEGDVTLLDYDSNRPRLLVSGLSHGFDIMHVDTEERSLNLIYSTKNFEDQDQDSSVPTSPSTSTPIRSSGSSADSGYADNTTTPKRPGLRQQVKKNYADMDRAKCFGFSYEQNLDLLAVCMVVDGILYTSILNNVTLKPTRKLTPVKLSLPKGMATLGCSNINVLFNESYIAIKLSLFDADKTGSNFDEVYTANLIGEDVESILMPMP